MKNFTRTFPKYSCVQPSLKQSLFFRPFLVGDEKTLLIIKEEKNPSLIIKNIVNLLSTCFDDLDIDTLTLQDMEFLFCMLRSKSVGEIVKTNFTCPATGEKISVDLDLTTISLSSNNRNYLLKLDENYQIFFGEPTISKILAIKGDFDMAHLIKASIVKVLKDESAFEAQELSEQDLEEIVKNLTAKEHLDIKNFIVNLPKSFADITYTTKDGTTRKMRLDGVLNFFTYA
jgi:hypothetical protein